MSNIVLIHLAQWQQVLSNGILLFCQCPYCTILLDYTIGPYKWNTPRCLPEPSVSFYDILFPAHDCRVTSYMIDHVDHIRMQLFRQQ